jgi:tetratricopeptide (TPR) repeat protein
MMNNLWGWIMQTKLLITVATTALFFAASPAFSVGSGGGSSGNSEPSEPTPTIKKNVKKQCKRGFYVVNGVCKRIKRADLSDDELYQQGEELALAGEYDWALEVLAVAENQNDPRILNYIGYSHRKSGRLETAVSYYRKALAIDPDYVKAREYLGEGYVVAGRIDLARIELEEIGKRCGKACMEYQLLEKAINQPPS